MITRKAVVFFCTLALGAGAHGAASSGPNPDSVKETPAMTSTAETGEAGDNSRSFHPKLDAEQVLLRLLELIRSSKSVADFTQEHMKKIMGVDFPAHAPGRYGYGEQLTSDWWYGLEMRNNATHGARFSFSFSSAPGSSPPMTDICQVDFDRFTAELEAMGFARQRYYGEHGRFIMDWFDHPGGMRIEVYPDGEYVWTAERGGGRTCVKMVLIP
jgi:hypothetical protein